MYCNVDDIARAIGTNMLAEATQANKGSGIDNEVINSVIASQSSYIDSYLHGRYLLPISDSSDLQIFRNICIVLVIDELYSRRLLELPDSFIMRKKSAISDLEKIARGMILLNTPKYLSSTSSRGYRSISKREQIFTDKTLRNLI